MMNLPKVFTAKGKKVVDSRELAPYLEQPHDACIARLTGILNIDPGHEASFWEPAYSNGETEIRFLVTLYGALCFFPTTVGFPADKAEALIRAFGHSDFAYDTHSLSFGPENGTVERVS